MIIEFSKREIADDKILPLLEKLGLKLGYGIRPMIEPTIEESVIIIQDLVLRDLDRAIKELFLAEERSKVESQINALNELVEAQAEMKMEASKMEASKK
jgi:hypothetical protein